MPSNKNALGRVKFLFPNPFSVYMHDTNAKSLFSRSKRAYSHGCIRLAKPIFMLEQLANKGYLNGDWSYVKSKLDSMKINTITLKKPIPVHVAYYTAYVNNQGKVKYLPDVYGFDTIMPLKKAY